MGFETVKDREEMTRTLGDLKAMVPIVGEITGRSSEGRNFAAAADKAERDAEIVRMDAEARADEVRKKTREEAEGKREKSRRDMSAIRTSMSRNGLQMSGSKQKVLEGAATESENQYQTLIMQGEEEAERMEREAGYRADVLRRSARDSRSMSRYANDPLGRLQSGTGSLISAGGEIFR